MEMTITASLVVAVASLGFTFYREITNKNRQAGNQETLVMAKLDVMDDDLKEIKVDMKAMRASANEDHEAILEMRGDIGSIQSEMKTIWKRIDELREDVEKIS